MPTPVNPHSTVSAKRLLDYLDQLPPGHILTGQHNFPATLSRYYERAHDLTGLYPAVWGQDFGFADRGDKDSIYARDEMIAEAIRQHEAGAIITLMWHAVRPIDDEPGTFQGSVLAQITPQAYADLVTPGTDTYRRWCAQVDVVAEHLTRLEQAGVPVLWRPYHEMNGGWFWWGGNAHYAALWKQLYHRCTEQHGLHNLLWVWNANAPDRRNVLDYAALYPGHDAVDILATDIYGGNYKQHFYTDLLRLADGKPVALGECGELPTPRVVQRQPAWKWFMTWTDMIETKNSLQRVTDLYHDPRAIHRDHPTLSWNAWRQRTGT